MRFSFEAKSTNHKNSCCECHKPLIKGEPILKATQVMYPGTRIGYLCYECFKDGIVALLYISKKFIKEQKKKE